MTTWVCPTSGRDLVRCDVRDCGREGEMVCDDDIVLRPPRNWMQYQRQRPILLLGMLHICDSCGRKVRGRRVGDAFELVPKETDE